MKRFLLLSFFLHVLLATAWPFLLPQKPVTATLKTLSVQLQAAGNHTQAAITQSDYRPLPAKNNIPPAVHDQQPQQNAANAEVEILTADITPSQQETEQQTTGAYAADTPASKENTALSNVRAAIYSALQAKFSYPRRARMRGLEGTVVIALRILPDGAVTDVHISNSSGIRILDDDALRSISAVQIPQVVAWMNGQELAMDIPVEYRLTDS